MELTDDQLCERAVYRRERSNYGIGAALGRDLTECDRDRAKVFDGVFYDGHRFGRQEILVLGLNEDTVLDPEVVEKAVERASGRFAIESRLDDLQAAHDRVTVRLDDDN